MQGVSGRVLVVDDSTVIRQLITVNLELEGFEVVTAADGAECLETVHRTRPDVITLDVVMPRLDGLRAAERLRADPRTCRIPLALVSACRPDELDAGNRARVDAVLPKPFEPAALVKTVRRLAGGGRASETGGAERGGVRRASDRAPGDRPSALPLGRLPGR
ncbi:response regulator [Streptomyces sp. TR06-5]|uniref:response regulator n=1 Tax=Streptomyces sp. TR06-5 TaxID=3385976 RepID=UPI0039A3B2CC